MSEYIIELQDVVKSYDDKVVVNKMNLKIKEGQFVTFLGPSGCGKTTTLRMIAGFEQPNEGKILFDGKDIAGLPPYKRAINTVFQKYALFPHLNVFKNIAFGLYLKKVPIEVINKKGEKITKLVNLKNKPVEQEYIDKDGNKQTKIVKYKHQYKMVTTKDRKGNISTKKVNCYKSFINEKVRRALKIVDLSDYENRDVNSLSGGQQQRVAIARAIVNEPKVLLLDEPLGALDLKMRQEMQLELKEMHDKLGITFIYVTHDQEEALTMSDTIVVMRDGKICQEGSPLDIYNEPQNAYVADFIGESNILDGIMPCDKKVIFAGKEWDCVDTGFKPNQPVDIMIRPEDWIIREEGKGIIDGEIVSSFFRGVHYEMACMAGGFEFTIHNTVEYPVGSKVGLYVKPFDIQIMNKEVYSNNVEVEFLSNTTFDLYDGTYEFNPTTLFENCTYDSEEDILKINDEEITLKGKTAIVKFEFNQIELTDDEMDAPLAANVESMVFKGKNYLVALRTDNDKHIFADTEYLWDDGDRVGIAVNKEDFKFVEWVNKDEK